MPHFPVHRRNLFSFHWSPKIGFSIGILFTILGFVLISGIFQIGWWRIYQIRWAVGITIILFGILRMIQFLPFLLKNSQPSLREQIKQIDENKK